MAREKATLGKYVQDVIAIFWTITSLFYAIATGNFRC
jgi:hypothetical protein